MENESAECKWLSSCINVTHPQLPSFWYRLDIPPPINYGLPERRNFSIVISANVSRSQQIPCQFCPTIPNHLFLGMRGVRSNMEKAPVNVAPCLCHQALRMSHNILFDANGGNFQTPLSHWKKGSEGGCEQIRAFAIKPSRRATIS